MPAGVETIEGLSPRVRRNRISFAHQQKAIGSISAGAEEPDVETKVHIQPGVYLRGCGGTKAGMPRMRTLMGLSPRVRRNPYSGYLLNNRTGSISAGAEEP